MSMGEPNDTAPDLGEPTDAQVGEETAAFLIQGDTDDMRRRHDDLTAQAQTMQTPDDLGGTGGQQEGGAG